jgi:hypothetical protein
MGRNLIENYIKINKTTKILRYTKEKIRYKKNPLYQMAFLYKQFTHFTLYYVIQ